MFSIQIKLSVYFYFKCRHLKVAYWAVERGGPISVQQIYRFTNQSAPPPLSVYKPLADNVEYNCISLPLCESGTFQAYEAVNSGRTCPFESVKCNSDRRPLKQNSSALHYDIIAALHCDYLLNIKPYFVKTKMLLKHIVAFLFVFAAEVLCG